MRSLLRPYPIVLAALLVIFALLPLWLKGQPYWFHIVIYTLWWVYITTCWSISAMTKMYSFFHTGFIGAGAYTSTLLFLHLGMSPWLGMLAGVLIAVIMAVIIGWTGARFGMSPLSFVVMSLALTFVVLVIGQSSNFLGSSEGLHNLYLKTNPARWQFVGKEAHYYIILAMVVGIILVNWAILRSKLGLYFKAIFDNERAAAAVGVDVLRYKVLALALSAALIAPAGTFWAQYQQFINPESVLTWSIDILLILYAALGGLHTLWGPVVAPIVFTPLTEVVRGYLPPQLAGANMIVVGIVALLMVMFMRWGIMNYIQDRQRHRQEARLVAATTANPGPETKAA